MVARGDVSAIEVAEAHIARCQQVNPRLNALVVPTWQRARAEAAGIDAARREGRTLGPLAGVPVTIKECFDVAGVPTTLGIVSRRTHRAACDAPLVQKLTAAGAVILGKTNVPLLMLSQECDNPLYGRTLHPDAPDRSPGGSSGGEAALIAAGASPLGLGTDLGGSIRQPAHSCGIQGFKPSTGRLTRRGSLDNLPGMEAVGLQPGPMARQVDDLSLFMQVCAGGQPDWRDPLLAPVPWRDPGQIDVSRLRVAMWTDDGVFRPSPAIRQAVLDAAKALEGQGAFIEPFQPPAMGEAVALFLGLLSADGGQALAALLDGSPIDRQMRELMILARLPRGLNQLLGWACERFGETELACLVRNVRRRSAGGYWRLVEAKNRFVERFMTALDEGGFDVLLLPPHGLPALKHGTFSRLFSASSYCLVPNLLGLPAGVVAAGRVPTGQESDRPAGRNRSQRLASQVEQGSSGLPVGVQVAARPWCDDVALAVMRTIERQFADHHP